MNRKIGCYSKQYKYTSTYYRKIKCYIKNLPKENVIANSTVRKPENTSLTSSSHIFQSSNGVGNSKHSCQINENIFRTSSESSLDLDEEESNKSASDSRNEQGFGTSMEQEYLVLKNLKNWMLKHKITHVACNEMLQFLRDAGMIFLPKDSRTFLSTPKTVQIVPSGTCGEYWHNGIEKPLKKILNVANFNIPNELYLIFNIDGLPTYKSSKYQFWPILAMIDKLNLDPFVVGIYYGKNKPSCLEEFLRPFVDDLNKILKTGIDVENRHFSIKVKCFICDTPARSFVKGTVNFNHYHGCSKCEVIGEYHQEQHHMSFPRIDARKRTEKSFRDRLDSDHHKI